VHHVPRVAIATLGCKVNQCDSEGLAEKFRESGFDVVGFGDEADVYVVNTCTVTATGDKKSRQLLRRAVGAHPDAVVVATGCYAQASPDKLAAIEGVALVSGSADRSELVDAVCRLLAARDEGRQSPAMNIVTDVAACREYQELPASGWSERTRAFLKIEDGCENFCAYCKVPYVRGPVRSRRLDNVVAEAKALAARGYRELVLTGIDLGAYGRDFGGSPDLADVLAACASVDGVARVRLSSVDPRDVKPSLIEVMATTAEVCPHLHIPLQSGSDEVLRRMNRNYTHSDYLGVVESARRRIGRVAITTDVIVGFPGETDEDFEYTVELARAVGFARMHVFAYSRRTGTPAASMPDQVPENVKQERSAALIRVGEELSLSYHGAMVGSTVSVLVEQAQAGQINGLTDDYVRVTAPGYMAPGELVDIKITRAMAGFVSGVMETTKMKAR
jgi:threonylcarbamoyladenosine tRNA methylthiotransferase MtaB